MEYVRHIFQPCMEFLNMVLIGLYINYLQILFFTDGFHFVTILVLCYVYIPPLLLLDI